MKAMVSTVVAFGVLCVFAAGSFSANPIDTSPSPTPASMRALGQRIATGDQAAFKQLQEIEKTLYRNIDLTKEEDRTVANLLLMKATFDVLGKEAGKGNELALKVLKTSLETGRLSAFAPDALGIAAAAGNEEAMEMLMQHKKWGMLLSSTVFALQPAAQNGDSRAVEFLVAVIDDPADKALWYGASTGLAGAAELGNEKAKAALAKYNAATRQ